MRPGSMKLWVNIAAEATAKPKITVVIQLNVIAGGSKKMTTRPEVTRIVSSKEIVSMVCQSRNGSRKIR